MNANRNHGGILHSLTTPALALALFALAQLPAPAAIINFSSPATCAGDTDAFAVGQLAYAYDWGTAATINGVPFTASTSFASVGGGNVTLVNFGQALAATFASNAPPFSSLSTAYTNLLKGAVLTNTTTIPTTGTVTLNNLAVGHQYALQVWVNDSRGTTFSNRLEWIYDGSGGATNLLSFNTTHTSGGVGQYIRGTFLADNSPQNFVLDNSAPGNPQNNNIVQMNALQVRDVSSLWSGTTSGTWADADATSANFSGSSYSAVKALGLTNVYFADVDASGNAAARTAVTVGAGGASGMNAVFQNNSLAYAIGSADSTGITGPNGVTLVGTNTVTLTGPHTYTGSTVLGSNARLVIGASGSIASSAAVTLGANSTLTLSNSGALAGSSAITLAAGAVLDASSSSLSLGSSQTLSGSGMVKGNVTAASGATIVPGTAGGPGTLTFNNNLTLNAQTLGFDLSATAAGPCDRIVVGGPLTLNGTSFISLNFIGGTPFNGTYTLVTFPSISGGTFALDKSYPGVTLNNNATSVTLTVSGSITPGGTSSAWTNLASGNWTTAANWQNSVIATNTDALADFSTLTMNSAETVTINSLNMVIGHMVFGDVGQTYNWTLTAGTNRLSVSSGSPIIAVNSGRTTTINSVLAGSQGMTKQGAGTLVLGAANTLTGGVNVLGGTLSVNNAGALGNTSVSSLNPVVLSNATLTFATSGALFYTNDLYLLGATNLIIQNSAAQDNFVGKISGSGVLQVSAAGGVVVGQRGDMSGFTGTVLVTGNASGNNAAGLILANGDTVTGISGSASAVWDYEGCTLNYLYSSSGLTATNYMGAFVGNNANVIVQSKNGTGTATGDVTTEIGALNTSTTFAGKFRDYANANTGTAPPKLGIRKVGTGTLTLSGANVNTGPTEVRNGNLTVSGSLAAPVTVYSAAIFELGGSLGSAPVTVNSAATFLVDNGASLGTAAVQVNGLMDVSAWGGFFNLGSASLSGSGAVKGAVTLAGSSINPGPVGNAGTLTINNGDLNVNGGTLAFDLSNDPTNGVNDLLVVNGSLNLNSPVTVSINKLNGSLGGGHYPLIKFSGSLSGSLANLTLSGSGPLDTLQQNGNEIDLIVSSLPTVVWTGGTAGNLWDVSISTNWLLNSIPATFTNGEAALFNDSGATNPVVTMPATVQPAGVLVSSSSNYTFTGAADIGGSASLTKSGTGTLTILNANSYSSSTYINGGTLKLGDGAANNGSVAGNISDNAVLVFANPADQTYGAVLSGSGTLMKQGAGRLTLTATNTLTGPTTISAGTLALGDGSSLDGVLGAGNVTNNSQLVFASTGGVTISNNITGTGGIDNTASGTVILQGVVSGSCRLTNDSAAGSLYLQSSNAYSGGTCINGGTVIVHDPTLHGLGSGNVLINDGAGTLWFSSGGSNVLANNIQLPSSSTADQFLLPGASTVRLTGLLTGGAAGQITRFVNLSAGGDNRGEIILDNPANSFTTIPECYFGILGFTSDGALGNPTNGISVNVGNKVNTQFYNRADDGLRFEANNITLNANRAINMVGNDNINVQSYNGTIAGPITGSTLTKRGTGSLTVNGPGSLANSTTVVGGTLLLNNTWSGTAVTVNSGATLGGAGTITAPITIQSGGALSPGSSSIGTLTVNSDLTLASGSTTIMEINATTLACDKVVGLTSLSYGGTLTVNNTAGTLAAGQSFALFSSGVYSNDFASLNLPALGAGLAWQWNRSAGTLQIVSGGLTPPTLTGFGPVTGGFGLTFSGPSSQTYKVLASTNAASPLTNWMVLTSGTFGGSSISYTDTSATNASKFYRISSP